MLGQGSIFDLAGDAGADEAHDPEIPDTEFSAEFLSRLEKETLGIFVSSHPLIGLEHEIEREGARTIAALQGVADKSTVTVIGMVAKVKRFTTRKGDPMAFLNLEDLEDSTEVVVFSELCNKCRRLLEEDEVIVVKGRVDQKGIDDEGKKEVKLVATEIRELVRGTDPGERSGDTGGKSRGPGDEKVVCLDLDMGELEGKPGLLGDMKELCRSFPGGVPVILHMDTADGLRKLKLGRDFHVQPQPEFVSQMEGLFGESRVNVIASPLIA